jgi:hypothetical protein
MHLRNLGTGVISSSKIDRTEEPRKRALKLEVKSALELCVFPTYSTGQKLKPFGDGMKKHTST